MEVHTRMVLSVVIAIVLALWTLVRLNIALVWSPRKEPALAAADAEAAEARRSIFGRSRVLWQRFLVCAVFVSAVLLLSALAADQYALDDSAGSDWVLKYGAFGVSSLSDGRTLSVYSWAEQCSASSGDWKRLCHVAQAASYATFIALLFSLLILLVALLKLWAGNANFNAQRDEQPPPAPRAVGPAVSGGPQCQLITPVVARCVANAVTLVCFAVLLYALVVYTNVFGWEGVRSFFGASWGLALTVFLLLLPAELFCRAQLKHGPRPDASQPLSQQWQEHLQQQQEQLQLHAWPQQSPAPYQPPAFPTQLHAAAAGPSNGQAVAAAAAPQFAASAPLAYAAMAPEGQPAGAASGAAARPHFCPFCGGSLSVLPVNARFCGHCGQPWGAAV